MKNRIYNGTYIEQWKRCDSTVSPVHAKVFRKHAPYNSRRLIRRSIRWQTDSPVDTHRKIKLKKRTSNNRKHSTVSPASQNNSQQHIAHSTSTIAITTTVKRFLRNWSYGTLRNTDAYIAYATSEKTSCELMILIRGDDECKIPSKNTEKLCFSMCSEQYDVLTFYQYGSKWHHLSQFWLSWRPVTATTCNLVIKRVWYMVTVLSWPRNIYLYFDQRNGCVVAVRLQKETIGFWSKSKSGNSTEYVVYRMQWGIETMSKFLHS